MPVSQIVTNSIANDAVTTVDIADLAVTPAKMSQKLTSDTAKTATSTSVDFTGIPSWVRRITVMFNGVSTNGTSNMLIQLGDSGGFETTGYLSQSSFLQSGAVGSTLSTIGFVFFHNVATDLTYGNVVFTLFGSNTWQESGNQYKDAGTDYITFTSGTKTLSDTLTQVRITTVNGTDAFDSGTINILYE
jgi:hypothetical protein